MFLLLLLALAILVDISLIHNSGFFPWVSIFIWQMSFLFILIYSTKNPVYTDITQKIQYSWAHSKGLIIISIILSLWFVIFTNPFYAISFFLLLLGIDILLMFLVRNPWAKIQWIISQDFSIIRHIVVTITDKIGIGGSYIMQILQQSFSEKKNIKTVFKAIRILLIICSIILPLLLSSDIIFRKLFIDFIAHASFLDLSFDTFKRIISVFLIFFFIITIHRALLFADFVSQNTYTEVFKIDKIYNYIILGGINFIYLIFIFIQIRYTWFVDQATFNSLGISYGEYIHTGFYQLLIIAFINYIIYFYFFRKTHEKGQNGIRTNLIILIVSTLAIAWSAMMRISLYIEVYDMTILRFFVIYILGCVMLLFLLNLLNLARESQIYQKFYLLFVFMSFIGIWFLNIERHIAIYNITHAHNGTYDYQYISGLSDDAFEQKKYVFLDQRSIISWYSEITNTQIDSLSMSVSGESYPLVSANTLQPILSSDSIPWYYWNLTSNKVFSYLREHPEQTIPLSHLFGDKIRYE